jgi:hypothetical protein
LFSGALALAALGLMPEPAPTLPILSRVTEPLGLSTAAHAQYGTSRRVARRTSRRTSRRHSGYAYGAGVAYGAAIATVPIGVSYVTTLPGGCVGAAYGAVTYQRCGSVYYRPYYQGETVVYVQEAPEQGATQQPQEMTEPEEP